MKTETLSELIRGFCKNEREDTIYDFKTSYHFSCLFFTYLKTAQRCTFIPWEEIRSMTKVEWQETNKGATPNSTQP